MSLTVSQFVEDLHRRGVQLWAAADGLHVQAPPGVLTEVDRTLLRALRTAIIALLAGRGDGTGGAGGGSGQGRADPRAMTDGTVCVVPDCGAPVDAYDSAGRPWCAAHRPDAADAAGDTGTTGAADVSPWRCRCGSHVDGRLPRCATCLRLPDGRPSPCFVCGTPVVRWPPPPRTGGLRTYPGVAPVAHGPALEPFCSVHRHGAHVLHLAAAQGWPALTLPRPNPTEGTGGDGAGGATTIGSGRDAWHAAVCAVPDGVDAERWYLRLLIWLGTRTPPGRLR